MPRLAEAGMLWSWVPSCIRLSRPGLLDTAWHFSYSSGDLGLRSFNLTVFVKGGNRIIYSNTLESAKLVSRQMVSSSTVDSEDSRVMLERDFSRRKLTVHLAPSVSRPKAVMKAGLISW